MLQHQVNPYRYTSYVIINGEVPLYSSNSLIDKRRALAYFLSDHTCTNIGRKRMIRRANEVFTLFACFHVKSSIFAYRPRSCLSCCHLCICSFECLFNKCSCTFRYNIGNILQFQEYVYMKITSFTVV